VAFTALLDACVLYSAPKTDLLLRLALANLYRPRWTTEIHDEWMRSLAAKRPDIPRAKIERRRAQMDAHIRDALVTGHMALVPSLTLPDPDDCHVLAAAIAGRAEVIVTDNVTDFPPAALAPYGVEVQTPDEFLCHLLYLAPAPVVNVVRDLLGTLGNPSISVEEYLHSLERHGLPGFAASLRLTPLRSSTGRG
jgi:predicted nucleic acid-binding protein